MKATQLPSTCYCTFSERRASQVSVFDDIVPPTTPKPPKDIYVGFKSVQKAHILAHLEACPNYVTGQTISKIKAVKVITRRPQQIQELVTTLERGQCVFLSAWSCWTLSTGVYAHSSLDSCQWKIHFQQICFEQNLMLLHSLVFSWDSSKSCRKYHEEVNRSWSLYTVVWSQFSSDLRVAGITYHAVQKCDNSCVASLKSTKWPSMCISRTILVRFLNSVWSRKGSRHPI